MKKFFKKQYVLRSFVLMLLVVTSVIASFGLFTPDAEQAASEMPAAGPAWFYDFANYNASDWTGTNGTFSKNSDGSGITVTSTGEAFFSPVFSKGEIPGMARYVAMGYSNPSVASQIDVYVAEDGTNFGAANTVKSASYSTGADKYVIVNMNGTIWETAAGGHNDGPDNVRFDVINKAGTITVKWIGIFYSEYSAKIFAETQSNAINLKKTSGYNCTDAKNIATYNDFTSASSGNGYHQLIYNLNGLTKPTASKHFMIHLGSHNLSKYSAVIVTYTVGNGGCNSSGSLATNNRFSIKKKTDTSADGKLSGTKFAFAKETEGTIPAYSSLFNETTGIAGGLGTMSRMYSTAIDISNATENGEVSLGITTTRHSMEIMSVVLVKRTTVTPNATSYMPGDTISFSYTAKGTQFGSLPKAYDLYVGVYAEYDANQAIGHEGSKCYNSNLTASSGSGTLTLPSTLPEGKYRLYLGYDNDCVPLASTLITVTSYAKGTLSVSGGSTDTGTTTMQVFYRSNLHNYLTSASGITAMNFTYSGLTAAHTNATEKGYVVPRIAVYSDSSNNQNALQNDNDGSVQWTYIHSGTSGTVNFQDANRVVNGSYYDQDVASTGYDADPNTAGTQSDTSIYKGNDRYTYGGRFNRNVVLPAGTYKANLEYVTLFDHYAVVQTSSTYAGYGTGGAPYFDGINMRAFPAAVLNRNEATGTDIQDTDGLITTIPVGVDIYIGIDSYDTSTTKYDNTVNGSTDAASVTADDTLNLWGGKYQLGSAANVFWGGSHMWRRACCVIDGVFYEGWIDLHFTTFFENLGVNRTTGAQINQTQLNTFISNGKILPTKNASAAALAMVPSKVDDISESTAYGVWQERCKVAASTASFTVRWSWTFDSEADTIAYNHDHAGIMGAQSEYNTDGFWTLTSTKNTGQFGFFHNFTTSSTYEYTYSSNKYNPGNSLPPQPNGLVDIQYLDPLNNLNANADYLMIVYRTEDWESGVLDSGLVPTTNDYTRMCVSVSSGGTFEYTQFKYVALICDGTWNTIIIPLTTASKYDPVDRNFNAENWAWTRTKDDSTNDGIRLGEMTSIGIWPFGYGSVGIGKSIDIGMIGLFNTNAEAEAFGNKYISTYLSSNTGSVKTISTSNGTVTITKKSSGTQVNTGLIKDVKEGSAYTVTVDPAAGYYCSGLYWRPTGFLLNTSDATGGADGRSHASGFASAANLYNTYTATSNASKIVERVNMLDQNYYASKLFTGGTAVSGWQNSTFGNDVIMTQPQIKAYNDALIAKYASGWKTDIDAPVDITDVSKMKALTVAEIKAMINASYTSSTDNATAYTARNINGVAAGSSAKYGVVTARASIRALPTSTAKLNDKNQDVIQETGIEFNTAVWVLHTSNASDDGKTYYYVQAPNYKGWVDSSCIAVTTDFTTWSYFADPERYGDVITYVGSACYGPTAAWGTGNASTPAGRYVTLGTKFMFLYEALHGDKVSDSDSSNDSRKIYYMRYPARNSDGTIQIKDSWVWADNGNANAPWYVKGHQPYTWNNFVKNLFYYNNTTYSWGNADYGKVDCSALYLFALRPFGLNIMRNTSQQESTSYTNIMNGVSYSNTTLSKDNLAKISGLPTAFVADGHCMVYLGYVSGKHYLIHAPNVGQKVQVVAMTDDHWNKYAKNIVIMAPNTFLEDSPLHYVNASGSAAFNIDVLTPAVQDVYTNSDTQAGKAESISVLAPYYSQVNSGVIADASTLKDLSNQGSVYILNCGGRDVYVWAEFKKITSEYAYDVELVNPYNINNSNYNAVEGYNNGISGFILKDNVKYGGITFSSDHTEDAVYTQIACGSNQNFRITVFEGYELVRINDSTAYTSTEKGYLTKSATGKTISDSSYPGNGSSKGQLALNGTNTNYAYTFVDNITSQEIDYGFKYTIQPIKYTIKYNTNYPAEANKTADSVTGSHVYDAVNNGINNTAAFTTSGTASKKYSKTTTFSCTGYKFLGWSTSATGAVTYKNSGTYDGVGNLSSTKGYTYNLYAIWAPINSTLSVEYVSQVDRELIGTPDGFCVVVGGKQLGNGTGASTETPKSVDLSKYSGLNYASVAYANGILSITSDAKGTSSTSPDTYVSIDMATPTDWNMVEYRYMAITYRLSEGKARNHVFFKTNKDSNWSRNSTEDDINHTGMYFIGDGEWHTVVLNMSEMTRFYYTDQYLKAIRMPGGDKVGSVMDIKAIKFYKNPLTLWGDSLSSNNSSNAGTALTKQGSYNYVNVITASESVNVISAQQADYDFAMDITKAYMFFYSNVPDTRDDVYTSAQYSSSGWNTTFGTPKNLTVNGVTRLGYDVSNYIKSHTFDMAAANFKMPEAHVELVFVCDYVHYEVKVFSYTATASASAVPNTNLVNNAGSATYTFPEATITISSSKNDAIVGRYGSTVALSVSNIASGKKFLGWYEKAKDESTSGVNAYGKLISSSSSFTLTANLHKNMEVVAVFGSNTSTNTVFNFCNVSGQTIQTFVAAKGSYIPYSIITAVPYKTGSAFSHWELLKNADRTKAVSKSLDPDGDGTKSTYYLLDGTTQPTYKYTYSVLYTDKNCTKPAFIYVNGAGGTVNIDAAYTKLSNGTVTITMSGTGTINGGTKATVAYNTTVTAKATGTSAFKGWVDMTKGTARYTPEAYVKDGLYYPYLSYSKTFNFKAVYNMTISPIYASAAEDAKKPNVSIAPVIQRVNATDDAGNGYYKFTAFGLFTADPGTTYKILEWGTLFFLAPDANTVPTTTSYDKTTGAVKTTNILTTDTQSAYLQHTSNSNLEANPAGQYAANANVRSARTIYVRMYVRYSYTDSTTGETEYVVTYSNTYKFTTDAYKSGQANVYITPTLYDTVDLNPKDYDNLW